MSDYRGSSSNMSSYRMQRQTMSTCQQLANIIGGEVITSTLVCVVQRLRNIDATILGRRTRSPLALPFALSFENNRNGRTLNLGETVILQNEINRFLTIQWEKVETPFRFAGDSYDAALEV